MLAVLITMSVVVEAHEVDARDAALADRLDGLGDGVAADVLGEVVEGARREDRQRDARLDRDARRARHGAVAAADGEHLGALGRVAQHRLDVVALAEFDDLRLRQCFAHLVDDSRAGAAARRRVDDQHHARAVWAAAGSRPAAGRRWGAASSTIGGTIRAPSTAMPAPMPKPASTSPG